MKKITGILCALMLLFALTLFMESSSEATPGVLDSFNERYGPTLAERFSCELCHPPGSFSQLNSYGQDLVNAIVETGNCLEFHPPNTHDIALGQCEYMHAEGHTTPFSAGCTTCHGTTLEGLIAPSCYLCHGKRWSEDGPQPSGETNPFPFGNIDEAFVYIETADSDGDGFSNIAEINAKSHPGNANITPGYNRMMDVSFMSRTWRRAWFDDDASFRISIKPSQFTDIDLEQPIYLQSSDARLFPTQISEMGDGLEIEIPRALLLTLFKDLDDVSKDTITIVAINQQGERVVDSVEIMMLGKYNATFVASNNAQVNPRTWDSKTDVMITINDPRHEIDLGDGLTAIGPGGSKELEDVERQGSRVIGMLPADDALAVIGPGMEDTNYSIVVVGSGLGTRTAAYATAKVQAIPGDGGGGGDDCLDFNPPGSHTEPRGECEYLHAPGADQPFANNCTICHGNDLRGSGIAPSCYLCHDAIWQTAPRLAPRAGK